MTQGVESQDSMAERGRCGQRVKEENRISGLMTNCVVAGCGGAGWGQSWRSRQGRAQNKLSSILDMLSLRLS